MEIVQVGPHNLSIYLNLAQSYEGEFSAITGKQPNAQGIFELDTRLEGNVQGFLLLVEHVPAGLAAILVKADREYEVSEFYIVPCFRGQFLGLRFAHAIWRGLPGLWEVKQIAGAEYATVFWRKTIRAFPPISSREDQFNDPRWGWVTRQQFNL